MMRRPVLLLLLWVGASLPLFSDSSRQTGETSKTLDDRVTGFLDRSGSSFHDMNVPEADGRALHDIVVKNQYKRALEIGTSTGYSAIWTAWALAKTGGRLVTIDIDEGRYRQALANFKAAGLDAFIEARLADAHELIPRLEGPFDFVFIDADKDWYINYAKAVIPKVRVGGCIVAHNVSSGGGWGHRQGADYYEYVSGLPWLETSELNGRMAVSYKRAER
jgi:caffeoyl-CoA O-methyltransferase